MIVKSIQITDNDINIAYQKPSATGLTDVFTIKSKYGVIEDVVEKVSVEGIIQDANSTDELKFKTDWLSVEYADRTFAISVQDLIDECVRFIAGKRAQGALFADEE